MIGIGFYLIAIIRIVTFVAVLIIKIRQAEYQSEETNNTLKIVGGFTLISLIFFVLIQFFYWIIDINEVLGRQLSWVATFLIFGIGIPFTIIKRSQKMTQYMKAEIQHQLSLFFYAF